MTTYVPTIGLEIHVQLATQSKAFSSSGIQFGALPNSLTDPTVLGLPGALPTFNQEALALAIRLGLACGCDIREWSRFARKHYFYPDSPKGYQITQHEEPICEGGQISFLLDGELRQVPLTRIHLEEDAGKSTHGNDGLSRVDLNRAGVPLCEIVTDPALSSAKEAAATMRAIRQLVRALGVSEGDLEKGHLRCDANVSIRPSGQQELGVRTELKNINSFRFVEDAIDSEIARQKGLLSSGGAVQMETRLWDAERGVSRTMRTKEDAEDYRYFSDPDLPPLWAPRDLCHSIASSMPELPLDVYKRYVSDYGLSHDDAFLLSDDHDLSQYMDQVVSALGKEHALQASNWIQGEFLRAANKENVEIAEAPVTAKSLASLIECVEEGLISGKIAKAVFQTMWKTGDEARQIVERESLQQISDPKLIEDMVKQVIEAHPKQIEAYRGGKTGLLGFFVGQVMKASKGQANPELVHALLSAKLNDENESS
jgi:aspartyl-tRNA(Asn)/glutamyl-tRNA(Gln) amidotransferase subunit B